MAQTRPKITLKLATSADGKITTRPGESPWITGPEARDYVHELRAQHDAILIGGGTAVSDDPLLTCRLPGLEKQSPIRVILDGRLQLSPSHQVVKTARKVPTWIFTTRAASDSNRAPLEEEGVVIYDAPQKNHEEFALQDIFVMLATLGVTNVMIEGGAHIARSVMRDQLVDRIVWLQGPRHVGGDAMNIVEMLGFDRLSENPHFQLTETRKLGADDLSIFEKTN